MSERYDAVIIGGGPGGQAMAVHAARYGARVAIIESKGWGGTCTHRGCVPTKALLTCSHQYAVLSRLKRLGVSVAGASFDFTAVKKHQAQLVRTSALGAEKQIKEAGIDRFLGLASISSPEEIRYIAADGTENHLETAKIVIAWGSEPQLPPGIVLSGRVLTSDGMLARDTLPGRVIIIGGSVIGVEFATFLAELGVQVAIVELLDRLVPTEEKDLSDFVAQLMNRLGVAVHTATRMKRIAEIPEGVEVETESEHKTLLTLKADIVLVCTGRKPSLRESELQALGIAYDRGGIQVDGKQITTCGNVFAIGDVTGGMMLAHRAAQQGKALASRLFGDGSVSCGDETVPAVIYTHPNVARVGVTEAEAARRGMDIEVVRSDYGANIMARAELEGQGFAKLLFHQGRLCGASIAGEQAGNLIAALSLAVKAGVTLPAWKSWILPHPTMAEVMGFD
jgi:dihydrolipoamide dehydrogenase